VFVVVGFAPVGIGGFVVDVVDVVLVTTGAVGLVSVVPLVSVLGFLGMLGGVVGGVAGSFFGTGSGFETGDIGSGVLLTISFFQLGAGLSSTLSILAETGLGEGVTGDSFPGGGGAGLFGAGVGTNDSFNTGLLFGGGGGAFLAEFVVGNGLDGVDGITESIESDALLSEDDGCKLHTLGVEATRI
jgi:hypothetical protein